MKHLIFLLAAFFFCSSAYSQEVRLTIYDDGLSCPSNCDSHVVFHPTLNGTQYAHHPDTKQSPFRKCVSGEKCHICFASHLNQCMEVMYRGGGPSKMTFDFTPSFYSDSCPGAETHTVLRNKCKELKLSEQSLAGRVNCIKEQNNGRCTQLIATARAAKDADLPLYESCREQGETKFNVAHPKDEQRSLACAYEKFGTGGPNSKGTTWRKLLPAACREGSFVGKDGLDCCNGIPFADGPLGRECRSFYPE